MPRQGSDYVPHADGTNLPRWVFTAEKRPQHQIHLSEVPRLLDCPQESLLRALRQAQAARRAQEEDLDDPAGKGSVVDVHGSRAAPLPTVPKRTKST